MPTTRPPHLQLVPPVDSVEDKSHANETEAEQLTLSFSDQYSLFLFDVSKSSQPDFLKLVADVQPRYIFDARPVPRLDVLAGSRTQAFQLFSKFNCSYVDLFGRLNIGSTVSASANPALWVHEVPLIVARGHQSLGPYIFIFDDSILLDAAARLLGNALSTAVGREITVARLR